MSNWFRAQFAIFALALGVFVPTTGWCDSRETDKEQIRKIVGAQQEEAWNKHDAKAYANLFTEDGDCVNIVGWWWKGRSEIEQKLTAAYKFVFAESILKVNDVDVRFLSANMAVAHVHWTLTGAKTPGAIPKPQQGLQTQVLQKQTDGRWLVAVFQNTISVPEFPFPAGPPNSAAKPAASP